MQRESTVTRQLRASVACVVLTPVQFNAPQAMAERLAAIREERIARMAQIIAAESEHLANSITWRDAFCHECDGSECMQGTARQLATKIFDLGWCAPSKRYPHLNCLSCQEVDHAA